MVLDPDAAYLAVKARDARFDGRLFIGVTTTGVYCRPVCRVRTPRRENCRFFDTRAQAEAELFRPCLKCRPEIAPGLSQMDSSQHLADTAARWIEHAVHSSQPIALPDLAARLGVTDRHLRRIFQSAHGVAPHEYLTTQRLLLAKHLLTDTTQPITQVALASGFGSLRRFNAAFAERYRLNPTQLRRERDGTTPAQRPLRLAYRPPYDIEAVLAFFAQRQLRGIEEVDGLEIRRTLGWSRRGERLSGWLSARFVPDRHEVHVSASASLAPVLGAVLQAVRHGLDLDADPALIDPVLALVPGTQRAGTRLPGSLDGFELAVRVILGQQVTVKAARTLTERLVQRHGTPIETPFAALTHVFPDAATLASADPESIGTLGIVRQRVKAIQSLAAEVAAGRIALHRGAPLTATLDALRALPGIGEWTAQVIAMRALAWPDAWPASDIGLMNALGSRDIRQITALAEPWRPWRAYAVMRLWHQLEQRVPAGMMRGTDIAELLLLGALWGASFLFMRIGAPEFGPVALVFVRVGGATLFLLPLLVWRREVAALRRHWRPIAVLGLTNSALPFVFFTIAALVLNAGMSGIFNATAPLWGALIAWIWLKDKPTAARTAGLAIGFAGVLGLAWDRASFKPGEHGVSPTLGIAACLVATAFYGYSVNYAKKRLAGVPPMAVAAGSQLAATAMLALPAWWLWPQTMPGTQAWIAAAMLALACTGVAYVLYFRLIQHVGPAQAISVTYLLPAFAILWGALFLGESVTWPMVAGCAVILLGTALASGLISPRRQRPES